jgi:hypothetical protein
MKTANTSVPRPSWFLDDLHIFSLSSLVIAYPLYSFLAANPAYFVANDVWPGTIFAFTILLSLGIPFGLVLLLLPLRFLAGHVFEKAHFFLVTSLIALSFMPLLNRVDVLPAILSIPAAVVLAVFATHQLTTTRFFSIGLAVMAPLTVIFPAHFLLSPDMRQILSNQKAVHSEVPLITIENTPPIVMIVFDEFPLIDLLNARGEIDEKRFPNFADFASESTWYQNATTVHDYTLVSVPAILTGNYPPPGAVLPLRQNYPESLFNLLSGDYAIHALEQATSLASTNVHRRHWRQNNATLKTFAGDLAVMYLHTVLPENLADTWSPMGEGVWGGFLDQSAVLEETASLKHGEPERLRGWRMDRMDDWERTERLKPINEYIHSISGYPSQTFHFMHILLPHFPFQHLPSGRLYNFDDWPIPPGQARSEIADSQPYIDQRRHAHLLQVGLVDTILGQFMATLKDNGLFEESLIVLVADHGIGFKEGDGGRILSPQNFASVGFVPLFIKFPDQTRGTVDFTNVQTIDIAPTILDVLAAAEAPPTDGRSLLDQASAPGTKRLTNRRGRTFEYPETKYLDLRSREHEDYIHRFSLDHPKATLYQRGPGLDYLGLSIDDLKEKSIPGTIDCPGFDALREIDLRENYVPLLLTGSVFCPTEADPENLIVAIAANGIVEAVARPFKVKNGMQFCTLLPEDAVRQSGNEFDVLLLPLP